MKTIKIFIASSEELKLERLEFVDMIVQLNKALKVRDIEIEPVKWEYLDAAMNAERKQTEYNNALKECELCLVLYWEKFGEYTEEELNTAYDGVKAGTNPQKLYIYFKEPDDEATQELKDFKANFATQYGHFYCKFENVDTMRLNFVLQFEQYQNTLIRQGEDWVKVKDSHVEFLGQKVADLQNVPFAGNNADYLKMKEDLARMQHEISTYEGILATSPNEALENLLLQKRIEREKLFKAIEEMELSLMNTAKEIVSLSNAASSSRLQRAIELFEKGDNKGADAVLNFDEIKEEMALNAQKIDLAREIEQSALKALMSNIDECKLKIKTMQTEKREGWLQQCMDIYEDMISKARGRIEDCLLVDILFDYAVLLAENNKTSKSIKLHKECNEVIYNIKEKTNYLSYISALCLLNLSSLNIDTGEYFLSELYIFLKL